MAGEITRTVAGSGGGVTDHGALTGLGDDDHTQYALRSILTTLGDIIYAGAAAVWTRLAGNITTTRKFLRQTGDGAASAAPAWDILVAADYPDFVASGVSHAKGAVPDPGVTGGTTKFLREDASWQVPAGGSSNTNGYHVVGLVGQNDAVAPNTKYGFSANLVVLRDPADGSTVVRTNTGTLTCDLGTTGANGLDTGVQAVSTWYHFYFIWNGTTLASLASTTAPPTGPSLPGGYTHWAYAGAIRSNASTQLAKTRMRGAWMTYETYQTLVTGGTATTETAVSTATVVPPNAEMVTFWGYLTGTGISVAAHDSMTMRYVSGSDFFSIFNTTNTTLTTANNLIFLMPNLSQNYYYLNAKASTGTVSSNSGVHGYTVPNGGE